MKLKFKQILNEDKLTSKEKFIGAMVAEMKKFYENRYEGTHWTSAASFGATSSPEKYKEHLSKVKSLGKQVEGIQKKFNVIEKLPPKEARELSNRFNEIQREYLDSLNRLTHIGELFSGGFGKNTFVDTYAVPIGVLITVYEKFIEEVYKPGVIDHNKTGGDVQLEYGLPNSDYGVVKYYDSLNGNGKYLTLKDNVNNDYLLGINHDWERKWREIGFDPEKLYYKRYKSLSDAKNDIMNMEMNALKSDIKGAEIDISPEHLLRVFEFIKTLDFNEIEREADEEQTTFEHMLGEEIDNFANWKSGFDMNISSREASSVAKYYLDYKRVMDQFNF